MKKILVFQHSPFEPLGLLIPQLRKHKFRIRYINFQRAHQQDIAIENYNGIIVLGGPMHPTETKRHPHLITEIKYLKQAIDLNIPVLGICLGAQLLALALGGNCYMMHQPELGWHQIILKRQSSSLPMLSNFHQKEWFFQWHYCSFELPKHSSILATNEQNITQIFHHRKTQIGLQFHIEATDKLLHRWLEHPYYLEHMHKHLSPEELRNISSAIPKYIIRSQKLAINFITEFIEQHFSQTIQQRIDSMHAGG